MAVSFPEPRIIFSKLIKLQDLKPIESNNNNNNLYGTRARDFLSIDLASHKHGQ